MTKQVKVSDETWELLSLQAKENYRTIGRHIDYLLNKEEGITIFAANLEDSSNTSNTALPQKLPMAHQIENHATASQERASEIRSNIVDIEEQIEIEKAFNQDRESRDKTIAELQKEKEALWQLWHELEDIGLV